MADAVCFGELLVDMVSAEPDATLQATFGFVKAPGGAPANVAVGLARLGVPTGFIGQVGDDPFGHWLRGVLKRDYVNVDYLFSSRSARTTIAFVATRGDGLKDICFYRNPGADAMLDPLDIVPAALGGARVFHCGSVSLSLSPCREAQLAAVKLAEAEGTLISYDPNWRPSLWPDHEFAHGVIWEMMRHANVVKVADEEWEFVTGTTDWEEGARKILAAGAGLLVVTRGAEGAMYFTEHTAGVVPGFDVDAVDTLGAGDAFVAGLLYQLLRRPGLYDGLDDDVLQRMLRFSNACGAMATLKAGAIPALPTLAEVGMFMNMY